MPEGVPAYASPRVGSIAMDTTLSSTNGEFLAVKCATLSEPSGETTKIPLSVPTHLFPTPSTTIVWTTWFAVNCTLRIENCGLLLCKIASGLEMISTPPSVPHQMPSSWSVRMALTYSVPSMAGPKLPADPPLITPFEPLDGLYQ